MANYFRYAHSNGAASEAGVNLRREHASLGTGLGHDGDLSACIDEGRDEIAVDFAEYFNGLEGIEREFRLDSILVIEERVFIVGVVKVGGGMVILIRGILILIPILAIVPMRIVGRRE